MRCITKFQIKTKLKNNYLLQSSAQFVLAATSMVAVVVDVATGRRRLMAPQCTSRRHWIFVQARIEKGSIVNASLAEHQAIAVGLNLLRVKAFTLQELLGHPFLVQQ